MAIVMKMQWPEASKDQYDQLRSAVNFEGDVPAGAKFHVAWFDENEGMNVVDLWDTREDFDRFVGERLMPQVQSIGVQGEPKITISDAHNIFAPNV